MTSNSGRPTVGRLHFLTDFTFQQRHGHAALAELAIRGGADTIQFRQKEGTLRDILVSAHAVAEVCRRLGVPLLVDDRVDVALAVGAAGVHLGQTDMPLADARRVLGPDAIIGITAPAVSLARAPATGGGGNKTMRARWRNPKPTRCPLGAWKACWTCRTVSASP